MRIVVMVVLSVAAGIGAGWARTQAEFAGVEERFAGRLHRSEVSAPQTVGSTYPKAVVVNGANFDFGTLPRNETRDHAFQIRNDGDEDLTVEFYELSCGKCISTGFTRRTIIPRETVDVAFQYHTRKPEEDFREYIELLTNDPENHILRLNITGKVTEAVRLSATGLRLGSLSVSETAAATFQVYGYHSDQLDIVSHEWANREMGEFFEVVTATLDVTDLDLEPLPRAAREVRVNVKPGMPVGPIVQSLLLQVDVGELLPIEMPIEGSVSGDISLFGPNFDGEKNLLSMGRIPRSEGGSAQLQILVRGPQRADVKLSIESIDPAEVLDATIGEPTQINNGAIHMYPLTVTIPQGARIIHRLGTQQSKAAKITVATTHSIAKQLLVYVSFAIE